MLEGDEVIQQDANESVESSEPQETSAPENQEVSAKENSQATQPTEKALPFHEDPKIRDYIERQIASRESKYETRLAEMQRQFQERQQPAQPKKDHPFVEALRSIDPKYGEWAGSVEELKSQLADFRSWQQEQQRQAIVSQYESSVEKMHSEMKTSPELKEFIKEQLDARAVRDSKFGLQDVPKAYRELHDKYTKLIESTKRAATAQYVQDKTKDASSPASQPKGKPATSKPKTPSFNNRDDAYASIVKAALTSSKAESDI